MTATVSGQSFVRTLRHYLDANEKKLVTKHDRRGSSNTLLPSALSQNRHSSLGFPYMSLLAVTSSSTPPLEKTPYMPTANCFSLDIHYLYFLYVQFEHLGLDLGTSTLLGDIPADGVVADHVDDDTGKAPSLLSIGSVSSTMSTLSLGSGWQFWRRRQDTQHQQQQQQQQRTRTLQEEIVHIHHYLSRITALKLHMHVIISPDTGAAQSGQRVIVGYERPLQHDVVLSLAPFQQLSFLELDHIHPRTIGNWCSFASRLLSLVIKRAGIEDAAEILQLLENADSSKNNNKNTTTTNTNLDNDNDNGNGDSGDSGDSGVSGDQQYFQRLQMLSLQDNNLITLDAPLLQHLQSVTHLNLSSNLLIDIPHSLSILYNLHSLNLANNMISFTMGINTILGNIQELNLRGNRLTNIVGLDRLWALERLDLRDNRIEDMTEIYRLVTLPNLHDIWIMGNPFTFINSSYRVDIFNEFQGRGTALTLDGMSPSFAEKMRFQPSSNNTQSQLDATPAATAAPSALHDKKGVDDQQQQNPHGSSSTPDATTTSSTTDIPCDDTTPTASGTAAIGNINNNNNKPMKLAKAKSKKSKRVIRLRQDTVEPSMETTDIGADEDGKPSHVLRYAELQQSIQPTLTRRRSNASKRSSKSTSTSTATATAHQKKSASSTTHRRSRSPPPPTPPSSSSFLPMENDNDNGNDNDDAPPLPSTQKRMSAEEAFRRKIEMMRQEAGTGWLRVLQEMETNKEKLKDDRAATTTTTEDGMNA